MLKKSIKILTCIITVVLAFILLNLLFMPTYIEENTDGRITAEYYREKSNVDVIFVGSSTVQAGISPMTMYREFGITSYDRSNSSQVIPVSYCMISDAIKRNKPELVVMDVGFLYQPDDYVDEASSRKSMDSLKWSKAKIECINAIMDDSESFLDYVFPILRFHSRWNDLSFADLKYWVNKPDVTYNGQLLQFEIEDGLTENNPYNLEEGVIATDRTMEYLEKIANICRENGVQLMLIKMPMIKGNWNEEIDNQIASFAGNKGIRYFNFIEDYDAIGLVRPVDFTDAQHMNSIGAEKFTKYLGKYIIENYSVSNRMDDINCKKIYDEKLQKYEKAMNDYGR